MTLSGSVLISLTKYFRYNFRWQVFTDENETITKYKLSNDDENYN